MSKPCGNPLPFLSFILSVLFSSSFFKDNFRQQKERNAVTHGPELRFLQRCPLGSSLCGGRYRGVLSQGCPFIQQGAWRLSRAQPPALRWPLTHTLGWWPWVGDINFPSRHWSDWKSPTPGYPVQTSGVSDTHQRQRAAVSQGGPPLSQ